jgi:hypothetical protein
LAAKILEEKLMSDVVVGKEMGSNEAGAYSKAGTKKQITDFIGQLNTVGSSLTRINEDGSSSVFTYEAAFDTYVHRRDDGSVENFVANIHGEWVWRGDRKDARRAYEIYNPIKKNSRFQHVGPSGQSADGQRYEARLAAVIALNGDATNYHYSPSGKLAGVVTVNGNQALPEF